jgi:membrane peptidoglycan carboxypeptidase
MAGARKFPSLKRALFYIHQDLRKVLEGTYWWSDYGDLTDLEILVVLLEDRRFLWHRGVDWKSVLREMLRRFTFQRYGGASTIDMQFVRTKTGFKERTIKRKVHEMLLAYFLQYRLGKKAILRSYISVMYLGWGIKGADKAARVIYGQNLSELNRGQLATIVAMMVYPYPKRPTPQWQAKVSKRAEYGLKLYDRYAGRYK